MKYFLIILILIFSCRESSTEFHDPFFLATQKGKIVIQTNPSGASIFLNDKDMNKITPDSLINLEAGIHKVKLSKEKFLDTTFTVISEDGKRKIYFITLKKPFIWKK